MSGVDVQQFLLKLTTLNVQLGSGEQQTSPASTSAPGAQQFCQKPESGLTLSIVGFDQLYM